MDNKDGILGVFSLFDNQNIFYFDIIKLILISFTAIIVSLSLFSLIGYKIYITNDRDNNKLNKMRQPHRTIEAFNHKQIHYPQHQLNYPQHQLIQHPRHQVICPQQQHQLLAY